LGADKISYLSIYINFLNFDENLNQIQYISGKQIIKQVIKPSLQKVNINDSIPDMITLCDLTKKEKFLNNICSQINQCNSTKFKFCFDENKAALCQNGYIYGKI